MVASCTEPDRIVQEGFISQERVNKHAWPVSITAHSQLLSGNNRKNANDSPPRRACGSTGESHPHCKLKNAKGQTIIGFTDTDDDHVFICADRQAMVYYVGSLRYRLIKIQNTWQNAADALAFCCCSSLWQ